MTQKSNKNCNNKYTLIYGLHAALEALQNPKRKIKEIFTTQAVHDNIIQKKLQPLLSKYSIKIVQNDFFEAKLPKNANHQGIIVQCLPLENIHLKDILSRITSTKSTIIILDQITDPQNIGAIFRSASAFGIDMIIAAKNNAPEENSTITRVACGGFEHIPFIRTNLQQAIKILKNNDYWVFGLDIKAQGHINEINKYEKVALILGSEGKGMRNLTSANCDLTLKIPMTDKIDSLNVANTAAICMFCRFV